MEKIESYYFCKECISGHVSMRPGKCGCGAILTKDCGELCYYGNNYSAQEKVEIIAIWHGARMARQIGWYSWTEARRLGVHCPPPPIDACREWYKKYDILSGSRK